MAFLLNTQNVFSYLYTSELWSCRPEQLSACVAASLVERKPGQNFNLRVCGDDKDLLIKQESHGVEGRAAGELAQEWRFYQLLNSYAELSPLKSSVIQPLHFDEANAILVFPYLQTMGNLSSFYGDFCEGGAQQPLPIAVAAQLGRRFAALHRSTFAHEGCHQFWLSPTFDKTSKKGTPSFLRELHRLSPEAFCGIPSDALKFFRFYQRYPAIAQAVEDLNYCFVPACIVHDDPRFANVLINDAADVTLIDWEKWKWGDPVYDLGKLVANYLKLWLRSLPISSEMDLSTALGLATVPLGAVQPSTGALVSTYLQQFPEIIEQRPDFLLRLTQFAGLALIQQVLLYVTHKRPIGNVEMAMVQVAKSLLCQPEGAIATVFGQSREVLENARFSAEKATVSATQEMS